MKKRRMKIFYMMAMSTVIATTGVTGTVGALRVSAAEIQMKSSVTTPKGVADFGRGNASITIQGNEGQSLTGKKINVYKIFDAENSVGGESINYTLNSMYADSVKTVVGKKLNKAGNQVTEYEVIDYIQSLNKNQVEGAKTDQKLEGSYSDYRYFVEELRNQLTKDKKDADQVTVSATKSDNSCIIGGLEYGYYIVDEVSEVGGTHSAASLCIVNTANPEAEVNIKSDYPTVIKKIQEDDDQAKVGNEGWNDIADYEIGQNVPYKYESTMPNANGYDTYYYAWHDKMDEALTFDKNSVPAFLFAWYEKDGMHLEQILRNIIRVRFLRPAIRTYETVNRYAKKEDVEKKGETIVEKTQEQKRKRVKGKRIAKKKDEKENSGPRKEKTKAKKGTRAAKQKEANYQKTVTDEKICKEKRRKAGAEKKIKCSKKYRV